MPRFGALKGAFYVGTGHQSGKNRGNETARQGRVRRLQRGAEQDHARRHRKARQGRRIDRGGRCGNFTKDGKGIVRRARRLCQGESSREGRRA